MAEPGEDLLRRFPNLRWYEQTSEKDPSYNCHAWAAGANDRWWDHRARRGADVLPWMTYFWPRRAPGDLTIESMRLAHATVGYSDCEDGQLADGFEKICHFVKDGRVTHTARQLPWGNWTSKLGADMDIEHRTVEELAGGDYGEIAGFMVRPATGANVPRCADPEILRRDEPG